MDIRAEFKNGMCRVYLVPSDEWEQKLLGAVAKEGETLSALVTYTPEGHHTYGKCKVVQIQLEAGNG
jgi:hypothetical protein